MDKKEEIEQAVSELSRSVKAADAAGAVDDILDEIMQGVNGYSTDFNNMYSKYNTPGADEGEDPYNGRLPVHAFPRRNYSVEAEEALAAEKATDDRINRKVAPSVREAYVRETQDAVRPEFSPDGKVHYPSFGVGESEERVVFDADWETQAKEEAARIDQFRRGNMLRGDSGYARSAFQFTGADEPVTPVKRKKSTFVDPLSDEAGAPAPADGSRRPDNYTPYLQERDIEVGGKKQGLSFSKEAQKERETGPRGEISDEESRGLSEEEQRTVDAAVIQAFSSDCDLDVAFKERWRETVERAQKRKEQKAKEAREEEAKLRSAQILEDKQRQVAQQEEEDSRVPPPPQKGVLPDPETLRAELKGRPEQNGAPTAGEKPEPMRAERLDAPVPPVTAPDIVSPENRQGKTKNDKTSTRKPRGSKGGFAGFMQRNFPARGDSGKEIVRKLVMDVSFVALMCALVYIGIYFWQYRARVSSDLKMRQSYEAAVSRYADLSGEALEEEWKAVKEKYPETEFPKGMNIRLAEFYAANPDTVGWLSIENTDISTVLLQRENNDNYYYYYDFNERQSRYGNPFVLSSCHMGPDKLNKNTVIVGRNAKEKMVFNALETYLTVEGYKEAPVITLDTLYASRPSQWKIFAVMLTNTDPADNDGYVFDYDDTFFPSDEAFMEKMEQIQARSMIHTGVDVQPGDITLMLCTGCNKYFKGGRLVIAARLVRQGESPTINKSLVYYNSEAIFPAAYYEKQNVPTTAQPPADTQAAGPDVTNQTPTAAPTQETAPSAETRTDPAAPAAQPAVPATEAGATEPTTAPAPAATQPAQGESVTADGRA